MALIQKTHCVLKVVWTEIAHLQQVVAFQGSPLQINAFLRSDVRYVVNAFPQSVVLFSKAIHFIFRK